MLPDALCIGLSMDGVAMEMIGYGIIVYAVLDSLTKVFLHVVPDFYHRTRKSIVPTVDLVIDD